MYFRGCFTLFKMPRDEVEVKVQERDVTIDVFQIKRA
jgi:hypothetical protein